MRIDLKSLLNSGVVVALVGVISVLISGLFRADIAPDCEIVRTFVIADDPFREFEAGAKSDANELLLNKLKECLG